MAVEDIVAEDQRDIVIADEVAADHECIGEAAGLVLGGIGKFKAEVGSVTQQTLEQRLVLRCRDDHDVPYPGEHQRRQRIVDHWLVEDGKQLLRDNCSHRIEA